MTLLHAVLQVAVLWAGEIADGGQLRSALAIPHCCPLPPNMGAGMPVCPFLKLLLSNRPWRRGGSPETLPYLHQGGT